MGLGSLLALPFTNIGLHAAGRSVIRSPEAWTKPVLRDIRNFAEELITQAFKRGMAGKKIKELPLGIVGVISPGVSQAVSIAHELGVKGRQLGVKSARGLEETVRAAVSKMDDAITLGEKIRKASEPGGAIVGSAIGGGAGAVLAPKDGEKTPYVLGGAALGLGAGALIGGALSKTLAKHTTALKANRPLAAETHKAVKGLADKLDAPTKSKLADKLSRFFFEN